MRPIDADALLNLPFERMIHTDFGETAIPIEEIETAPTLDPKSGDLISRENLREQINDCEYFNSSFLKMTVAEFLTIVDGIIDNAPTVAVSCKDCDGYEAGYSSGLKDAERPQGDCENCDYRKFTEKFIDGFVEGLNKYGIASIEQLSEILKGGAE